MTKFFSSGHKCYKKTIKKKFIIAGTCGVMGPSWTYRLMIDIGSFISCFGMAKSELFITGLYIRRFKDISR
jgi:hypothetical protein